MKKLLFYIIALLSVATALSGCKKDEEATELPPPVISVKEPKTYSCGEKSYSVRYSIENPREGVKLEAATGTKWITSLGVSEDAITFTLMENSSDKERSGSIELSYQGAEPVSLKIKQYEYSETPVISAPQLIDIGCYGGAKSILYQIKNPDDNGELKANSDVDWISAILIEEEKISFTVGENLSDSERTGRIILSYNGAESVKVTVKQKKYTAPEIQVWTQSFDVPSIGGNRSTEYRIINPKEGVIPNATVRKECDWITIDNIDDKNISFTVSENATGNARNEKITLNYNDGAATLDITVNQIKENILDNDESANCYIVSEAGYYQFKAVKGNSDETVGTISTAEVLWESFCTDVAPQKGDLISEVYAGNGKVIFKTGDTFKRGNAVIAVKDVSGKILWSWHIWMTDLPNDQVYANNAGTMMDRNLGAISANRGDTGTSGLFYQWGRKDPFRGVRAYKKVNNFIPLIATTLKWPDEIESDANTGTIDYAIANPTTFIYGEKDWCFIDPDILRWNSTKTIYDPCPPGYKVPKYEEIWRTALSNNKGDGSIDYKDGEGGANLGYSSNGYKFTSDNECWYPFTGYKRNANNFYESLGEYCYNWTNELYFEYNAFTLKIGKNTFGGKVALYNSCAATVRCQKIE